MADAYLPVWAEDMPAEMVFRPDGQLRERVREYVSLGIVRVIAGPRRCHVWIDLKRPYWRPMLSGLVEHVFIEGDRNG